MTITLNIPDETITVYGNAIETGAGVGAPQDSNEWAVFIQQTVLVNYMGEKFGIVPGSVAP